MGGGGNEEFKIEIELKNMGEMISMYRVRKTGTGERRKGGKEKRRKEGKEKRRKGERRIGERRKGGKENRGKEKRGKGE